MSSGINFKKDSSYDMMGEQKLEQNLHNWTKTKSLPK